MMKILVAYDGSINSQQALKYALQKASEGKGRISVLHVFNSSMFIDYGAGPRAEAMARRESSGFIEDARRIIGDFSAEISANVFSAEGNPAEEIISFAEREKTDIIFAPPKYKAIVKNAPCPVSIIPGTIILPVDNTETYLSILERVAREATASASKVVVLGIVPIHLYSAAEKKEIDDIQMGTERSVKKAKKMLGSRGIETKEVVRAGYPDEEIVKVADEYPITMIIVPESGDIPSELGKAASIIIDDSDRLKKPVLIYAPEN